MVDDTVIPDGGAQVTPETFSIDGTDYTPDQLKEVITRDRTVRELEGRYNTTFDKVWPAYGQSQNELVKTRAELDKLRQPAQQPQAQPGQQQDFSARIKELNLVTAEQLKSDGYMTKAEVQAYITEQNEVAKILSKADSLEKEIDGSDGRPKFRRDLVLYHADLKQIPDLKKAYEDMYKDELTAWKDNKIEGQRAPGLNTIRNAPRGKEPAKVKVDDSNLGQLLAEAASR